jgi:diguanylate cyclase (GGDEF)-like protein/PAS domain S-box-containing protein
MRVSLGLIMAVVSILMLSDLLGIIPDRSTAVIEGRKRLAETLAVEYSLTARKNDYDPIVASMEMLVERNDDVLSAALRLENGTLLAVAGDHEDNWNPEYGDKSTPNQMQVPIYRNARLKEKWGTVELRFSPLHRISLLGMEVSPLMVMMSFVSVTGFFIFLVLIRKIFTNIDPSVVVPTRVKRALDTLTEGVLLTDNKGLILFLNAMFLTVTGAREKDLLGRKVGRLGWKTGDGIFPWLKTQKSGESVIGEKVVLAIPGEADRHFMVNSSPVLDEMGERKGVMITFDDVTQLEEKNTELRRLVFKLRESSDKINRQNEELRILATRDPLTNCSNRRVLFDPYEAVYRCAIDDGDEFCCLMLDIDHFKRINDKYGHAVGDQVIKVFAGAVRAMLRDSDEIFRYGGEEFCVLLPLTTEGDASVLAERLRETIAALEIEDVQVGEVIRITSSIGVSSVRGGAESLSGLIDQADIALYNSKNSGRNRVTTWSDRLHMPVAGDEGDQRQVSVHGGAPAANDSNQVDRLPNRLDFRQKLAEMLAQARNDTSQVAVVLIDLDMFQRINNVFGYSSGDDVLTIVARRFADSLRANDPVTRMPVGSVNPVVYNLGGDEFGLLLTGSITEADVSLIVGRLVDALAEPFDIDGHQAHLTACIGISLYPADGEQAETLITRAGLALQHAKNTGHNTYMFFRNDFISAVQQNYELENDLRHAVTAGDFELYFQPQLDMVSHKIVSMEALIRWRHHRNGMIFPADFIPVAESTGMIVEIGEWVINAACRQIRLWQDAGILLPVSVNISAKQFRHEGLVEQINNAVAAAGIDPEYLEFEITESTIMENLEFALKAMKKLRKLGYRFAIDDFGTGYSSLEYLKRFPVSVVKIDRAFIKQVNRDPDDAAIVRAAIAMAHGMNMKVVAEGVENEKQMFFLRDLNCDMVQGYLLGYPLPAGEAIASIGDEYQLPIQSCVGEEVEDKEENCV